MIPKFPKVPRFVVVVRKIHSEIYEFQMVAYGWNAPRLILDVKKDTPLTCMRSQWS